MSTKTLSYKVKSAFSCSGKYYAPTESLEAYAGTYPDITDVYETNNCTQANTLVATGCLCPLDEDEVVEIVSKPIPSGCCCGNCADCLSEEDLATALEPYEEGPHTEDTVGSITANTADVGGGLGTASIVFPATASAPATQKDNVVCGVQSNSNLDTETGLITTELNDESKLVSCEKQYKGLRDNGDGTKTEIFIDQSGDEVLGDTIKITRAVVAPDGQTITITDGITDEVCTIPKIEQDQVLAEWEAVPDGDPNDGVTSWHWNWLINDINGNLVKTITGPTIDVPEFVTKGGQPLTGPITPLLASDFISGVYTDGDMQLVINEDGSCKLTPAHSFTDWDDNPITSGQLPVGRNVMDQVRCRDESIRFRQCDGTFTWTNSVIRRSSTGFSFTEYTNADLQEAIDSNDGLLQEVCANPLDVPFCGGFVTLFGNLAFETDAPDGTLFFELEKSVDGGATWSAFASNGSQVIRPCQLDGKFSSEMTFPHKDIENLLALGAGQATPCYRVYIRSIQNPMTSGTVRITASGMCAYINNEICCDADGNSV